MSHSSTDSYLCRVLVAFFDRLDQETIEYCVVGNYTDLPHFTSNDVDIWVADVDAAQRYLDIVCGNIGVSLYLRNNTANGSNNYFYKVESDSLNIVKIDLMRECAYKSIVPIAKKTFFLENIEKYRDFNVLESTAELYVHLIYPLATYGIVKNKYKDKLHHGAANATFRSLLRDNLGATLATKIIADLDARKWDLLESRATKVKLRICVNSILNFNKERLSIFLKFIYTHLFRVFNKNGIVVAFTGIDGAGKSSIVDTLMHDASYYFLKGKSKQYYWRPFLLPRIAKLIGSPGQIDKSDVQGRRIVRSDNNAAVKNYIKYAYYVMDFSLGKIKYFYSYHTGGLILFDRYHFDNIIYPQRFGFDVSKRLMRICDLLVPKVDILFYLTADSLILYNRKKEISVNEISKQKALYEKALDNFKNAVLIDTNTSIESTVHDVMVQILDYMNKKYSS